MPIKKDVRVNFRAGVTLDKPITRIPNVRQIALPRKNNQAFAANQ
jgi:hypothetical protein